MPRRPVYPDYVVVRIPKEIVDIYETPIFELLFSKEEAKMAKKIVEFIKTHERLYPDEYKEFVKTPADKARYFRVLRKMVSLGMIKRGKESSSILSDEFAHKLGAMLEKWRAVLRN